MFIEIQHKISQFFSKVGRTVSSLFFNISDWFYSSPSVRSIGWYLVSIFYILLLLLFSHVDLIIGYINTKNISFDQSVIIKHAHFVSFLTNVGLLLFVLIDLIISMNRNRMLFSTIVFVIGVMASIVIAMCSMGVITPSLFEYGAIDSKEAVWTALIIFIMALIVLKRQSLAIDKI